jgi:hypothetical protein
MSNEIKVVFLDLDGTLSHWNEDEAKEFRQAAEDINYQWSPENMRSIGYDINIQPEHVKRLNRLTDTTGAKLVISSSWRLGDEAWFQNLRILLVDKGIRADVIGRTPQLTNKGRSQEIKQWVYCHPEVEHFVALDDDIDILNLNEYAVHIDNSKGLTDNDVDAAIRILQREDL